MTNTKLAEITTISKAIANLENVMASSTSIDYSVLIDLASECNNTTLRLEKLKQEQQSWITEKKAKGE